MKEFGERLKNWSPHTCLGDVLLHKLVANAQLYINYANNYETILSTIDELCSSNAKFHRFLLTVDGKPITNMMK